MPETEAGLCRLRLGADDRAMAAGPSAL